MNIGGIGMAATAPYHAQPVRHPQPSAPQDADGNADHDGGGAAAGAEVGGKPDAVNLTA
jgi:hypothetical protein